MALDLEEQEQLEAIKAWWRDNGRYILAVLLAVALGFGGWQGWRLYQQGQAARASAVYGALVEAVGANNEAAVRAAAGQLVQNYGGTLYASMGGLVAAHYFDEHRDDENARAQLEAVIERSPSEDFRDIARLRLAGLLLDEKSYDQALKQLDAKHGAAYDALYAARKGDVLQAKGQTAEARAAYKLALEKAPARDSEFRASVRMRLEALGG